LLWGSLAENYGHRPVLIGTAVALSLSHIGCALVGNTAGFMLFRLLGGIFGAAPLANTAGIMNDIWPDMRRGTAMCVLALGPFAGPAMGPIVSGLLAESAVVSESCPRCYPTLPS
jgi:MFS family permease